jgi:hypothetical protein
MKYYEFLEDFRVHQVLQAIGDLLVPQALLDLLVPQVILDHLVPQAILDLLVPQVQEIKSLHLHILKTEVPQENKVHKVHHKETGCL